MAIEGSRVFTRERVTYEALCVRARDSINGAAMWSALLNCH